MGKRIKHIQKFDKVGTGMYGLYSGDKVLYNGVECEVVFYMACFCLEFKAGVDEIKRIPLFEIKFDLLKKK